MKIDSLSAEKFMEALAVIGENVKTIMDSSSGKQVVNDFTAYRGSITGDDAKGQAGKWLIETIVRNIPAFARENGDAVYAILGAVDGQSLVQYKATFTPKKFMGDCKELSSWLLDNQEVAQDFLAR